MNDVTTLQDLAGTINNEYAAAQSDAHSAVQHAIACGRALIEAKAKCNHGEWKDWLDENVSFSQRHALRYMNLAANWTRVSNLENAASIREALKLLDAPKRKASPEDQEKAPTKQSEVKLSDKNAEIVELARAGVSSAKIGKYVGMDHTNVDRALGRVYRKLLADEGAAERDGAEVAKQSLSLTAQQKFDKAIDAWKQKEIVDMRAEFQSELSVAIKREKDRLNAEIELYREKKAELDKIEKQLAQRATSITTIITQDEFKLIRGCLHPDRQPEELKDKFGRAFEIFNKLDQHVNIKAPIAWLRKHGWEKVSPHYRGK